MACNCNSGNFRGQNFIQHLQDFIGKTVTVFTTSGGASGCGFTGVVLSVNSCFLRLSTQQGTAPSNPLSESICGDMDNGYVSGCGVGYNNGRNSGCGNHGHFTVGSVVDIPIDHIAAFCHNAV